MRKLKKIKQFTNTTLSQKQNLRFLKNRNKNKTMAYPKKNKIRKNCFKQLMAVLIFTALTGQALQPI